MKYSHEITIDLPREKVLEIFDKKENLFKWQKGLQSFDHVSGTEGEEGAVSKMVFKNGKRVLEMEEKIIKKNFPDHYYFEFTAKGLTNWNDNSFLEASPTQTKWTQSNVFKGKGMVKVMMVLMPGMFKKQSFKYMQDFKTFAESEANK